MPMKGWSKLHLTGVMLCADEAHVDRIEEERANAVAVRPTPLVCHSPIPGDMVAPVLTASPSLGPRTG